MRIDVIPLRRLPTSLPVLSYDVPAESVLSVGSLVRVPFRRTPVDAIVWNLTSTYTGSVVPLLKVITPHGVLSSWQINILMASVHRHATSLAQLLHLILPAVRTLKSVGPFASTEPTTGASTLSWYTDRQEALERLAEMVRAESGLTLVLAPTKEALDELQAVLPAAVRIDGETSQKDFGQVYTQIAAGQVRQVIGTAPALFLPFPTAPRIFLDQEEHVTHQQTQRAPFLDPRAILEAAGTPVMALSPAPTLRWWRTHHPAVPHATQARRIGRLDQGTVAAGVSALAAEVASRDQTLWLLPRRGFAGTIACQDCGWVFSCPECQRTLRWEQQQSAQASCRFCGHQADVPLTCPRCQAGQVRYRGFTAEKLRASLSTVLLSTEQIVTSYHDIPAGLQPTAVIHVCGEALLQVNDYTAEERAWQMLHRISARFPSANHIVQAYQPDTPIWQHWALARPNDWYERALHERLELGLPPAVDSWVFHWRGTDGATQVARLRQHVEDTFGPKMHCLEPPVIQKSRDHIPRYRLMVAAAPGQLLREVMDWRTVAPAPWTIDTCPNGWLV